MKELKYSLQNYKLKVAFRDELDDTTYEFIRNSIEDEIVKYKEITALEDKSSEIYKFNTALSDFAGSRDFFDYIMDAIYWFGITDGIFNPFVVSTVKEDFENIQSSTKWEKDSLFKLKQISYDFPRNIGELRKYVDIDYTNYRVKFLRPLKLDLIGISKGIFIDKICKRLCKHVDNMSITFGGDKFYKTADPEQPWVVSIDNPVTNEKAEINLTAANQAVSVSGNIGTNDVIDDLSKYVILDPKNQMPFNNDLAIVIVKADNSKTADVLAKAFLIGTEEERTRLARKFPDIKRIEIDTKGKLIVY